MMATGDEEKSPTDADGASDAQAVENNVPTHPKPTKL
jgi:hypothetical protein